MGNMSMYQFPGLNSAVGSALGAQQPGTMDKFKGLFSNPEFIGYLASISQALNPNMKPVSDAVRQSLAAKSYGKTQQNMMDALNTMVGVVLGKDNPWTDANVKSDGSIVLMSKNANPPEGIQSNRNNPGADPANALVTSALDAAAGTPAVTPTPAPVPTPQQTSANRTSGGLGFGNFPLGLGDITPSELAVLTPEQINMALGGAQSQVKTVADLYNEQIRQRQNERQMSIMDQYYKGILNVQSEGNRVQLSNVARQMFEFMNTDQRTDLERSYEAAKNSGFNGNIWDFKVLSDSPDSRYAWNVAKTESGYTGSYQQWITDIAAARATKISLGPYETAVEKARAQAREFLYNANEITDRVSKELEATGIGLFIDPNDPESVSEYRRAQGQQLITIIHNTAGQAGANIESFEAGPTAIDYSIKWHDGTVENFRYAYK